MEPENFLILCINLYSQVLILENDKYQNKKQRMELKNFLVFAYFD